MMREEQKSPPNETAGILYAVGSYGLWGVLPLYWHMLGSVPPFELSYHRMVWSAVFGVIMILLLGRQRQVWAAVKSRKVLQALALSGLFIAFNWTIYIYAIAKAELVEASLGYYINPLLSIVLGVALLGEKMSALRLAAIGLAAVAVLFKALTLGHFPFIALGLALSFAIYGYIRKLTPVAALDGFTIETCLLLPFTAGILAFWGWQGTGAFTPDHPGTDILLILGGPLTALPLILFAAAAPFVNAEKQVADAAAVEIVVCPTYVSLYSVAKALAGSNIAVGGQDAYVKESGAYTAAISPQLLADAGCTWTIIGHSERREHLHENSAIINLKIKAALARQLVPVLCVGEKLTERNNGEARQYLAGELSRALSGVKIKSAADLIIAYEPIWAISTGSGAQPLAAAEADSIQKFLKTRAARMLRKSPRVLYGGSVNSANAGDFLAQKNIDGLLVGGASLNSAKFLLICSQ